MHFSACCGVKFGIRSHESLVSKPEDVQRPAIFLHQWTKKEFFWYFPCIWRYLSGNFSNLHCAFCVPKTPQLRLWGNCVSVSRQASLVWVGISVQAGTFRSETMHVCSLSLSLGLAFWLPSLGVQGWAPTPVISRVNNPYKSPDRWVSGATTRISGSCWAPTFFVVKFATLLESQGTNLMGDFMPLALFGVFAWAFRACFLFTRWTQNHQL